jgi:hypothetical protein
MKLQKEKKPNAYQLIHSFRMSNDVSSTVLWTQVGNLAAPAAEWTVGGTSLTSLMDVERRHGKFLEPWRIIYDLIRISKSTSCVYLLGLF